MAILTMQVGCIRKKMNAKQKIPLILHEHAFRKKLVKFQDGRMISLPPPTRHLLIQAGYNIVEQDASSLWIKASILVTGEIPRTQAGYNIVEQDASSLWIKDSILVTGTKDN